MATTANDKDMQSGQRPIKIARIIARLNVGGPAIHAVLLTEGLNDSSMQSVLITGHVGYGEADMSSFAEMHRVFPIVLPRFGVEISLFNDMVVLGQLYKILRRERPDIVHTHTSKAGALGRLAGTLAGVPIIVHTFHGHPFYGYYGRLTTALFVWTERLLARLVNRIVAISHRQLEELSETYRIAPRQKFSVIPLGFDLDPFLESSRSDSGGGDHASGQDVAVGIVGRMVPIKNHLMAIRAVERLLKERVHAGSIRLVLVGDGPLRAELEHAVQETSLHGAVAFTGWQSDIAKVYRELDLIMLTSANEGTPVVLIEAMASGLPFVATNVGGVPDLMVGEGRKMDVGPGHGSYTVYDNGILVEPDDVVGCAAAMTCLLRDPFLRRCMGEEGRRFVQTRYTKEKLLYHTRMLYLDLVRELKEAGRRCKEAQPQGQLD